MFVKICANTNLEDAQLAAELGADAVGFVFAPSKRQVTAVQVAAITARIPESVLKIGVFGTRDAAEILSAASVAGLTGVQVHGAFDSELVRTLNEASEGHLQIIQTVASAVDAEDDAEAETRFEEALRAAIAEPAVWAVLLDAAKGGVSGGLGVTFDWAQIAPMVSQVFSERSERPRLIVAGGLRANNVASAIDAFEPWGVDVASGVEAEPGRKDPEKLRAFLAAARQGS